MAIGHNVEFLEAKTLYADEVGRTEAHHHAKVRHNWSIDCEDIKIFRRFDFSRWRPFATLDSFGTYLNHPQ